MVIPLLLTSVFTLLALLHIYWALGGTFGKAVAVPEKDGRPAFNPSRLATLAIAACLFACATLASALAGWVSLPIPSGAVIKFGYLIAAVFFLRAIGDFNSVGLFKRQRGTRFAHFDSILYSPLCLALSFCLAILALKSRA